MSGPDNFNHRKIKPFTLQKIQPYQICLIQTTQAPSSEMWVTPRMTQNCTASCGDLRIVKRSALILGRGDSHYMREPDVHVKLSEPGFDPMCCDLYVKGLSTYSSLLLLGNEWWVVFGVRGAREENWPQTLNFGDFLILHRLHPDAKILLPEKEKLVQVAVRWGLTGAIQEE